MLAAPMPGSSDFMLTEAVRAAAARGLVEPHDHIVCLMSVRDDVVLKIVSVDEPGYWPQACLCSGHKSQR